MVITPEQNEIMSIVGQSPQGAGKTIRKRTLRPWRAFRGLPSWAQWVLAYFFSWVLLLLALTAIGPKRTAVGFVREFKKLPVWAKLVVTGLILIYSLILIGGAMNPDSG